MRSLSTGSSPGLGTPVSCAWLWPTPTWEDSFYPRGKIVFIHLGVVLLGFYLSGLHTKIDSGTPETLGPLSSFYPPPISTLPGSASAPHPSAQLTWIGMLGANAGLLRGAANGTDPFLFVDSFPEGLGNLGAFQTMEDLQKCNIFGSFGFICLFVCCLFLR